MLHLGAYTPVGSSFFLWEGILRGLYMSVSGSFCISLEQYWADQMCDLVVQDRQTTTQQTVNTMKTT